MNFTARSRHCFPAAFPPRRTRAPAPPTPRGESTPSGRGLDPTAVRTRAHPSLLDTLDEGIVVFSNGGNLVLANEAYCTFWDTDLEDGIGHHDLRAEILKWQERCTPTRIWTNLKELTNQMGMRKHWTETALMDDGRQLTCSASPISGGMTMIKFRFGGAGTAKLRDVNDAKEVLIASGG